MHKTYIVDSDYISLIVANFYDITTGLLGTHLYSHVSQQLELRILWLPETHDSCDS